MALTSDGQPSVTPFPVLLRSDCMGCHASGGTEKIMNFGSSPIPQVYHTDSTDLAGGNFAYIDGTKGAGGSDRKGHNIVDLVNADGVLSSPPGFRDHTANGFTFDVTKFTCAGSMGCHGYRGQLYEPDPGCDPEFEICGDAFYRTGLLAFSGYDGGGGTPVTLKTGAHHYNYNGLKDNGTLGTAFYDNPLANSYRFIRSLRGYGNEIDPWQNNSSTSHNEYAGGYDHTPIGSVNQGIDFGSTNQCSRCHIGGEGTSQSRLTTPSSTITGFCITCHGTFHSSGLTNGSSGAFVRHPADFVIPNVREYQSYTTYDITAPVARPSAFFTPGMTPSDQVSPGTDLVMCLSCHVAHASDNESMLRFDYNEMIAGGGENSTGCFACHTTKDTGVRDW